MKKMNLAQRIFDNAKNVLIMSSIVIVVGGITQCVYMKSKEITVYQSETLQVISNVLVSSITSAQGDSIAISTTNEQYLAGYQQLKACGEVKEPWFNKDRKYNAYNELLYKIEAVNQSLLALYAEGKLQTQYRLPTSIVLAESCKYGIAHVNSALNKLSVKDDLKNLNWAEKRTRNFNPNEFQYNVVSMPNSWHVKKNPWRGLDGCIYLANTKSKAQKEKQIELSLFSIGYSNPLHQQLCQTPDMYKQAKVVFDVDKENIKQSIMSIHEYKPEMMGNFTGFIPLLDSVTAVEVAITGKNSKYFVEINGHDVPVGFNAQLTINPDMQHFATGIAQCFTGKLKLADPLCNRLSAKTKGKFNNMESQSLVRQVGIAIIDVPSGRVDVATGSTNSCFDDNFGVSKSKEKCLEIPTTWKSLMSANQAMENPALYTDYMPGSTIKPIQALAMVRAFPDAIKANKETVTDIMASSDTEKVLDILTCTEGIYSITVDYVQNCQGFAQMQKAALDMGWNNECNGEDCGKQDVLYGQKLYHTKMQKPLFYGKLLTNDQGMELVTGLENISEDAYKNAANGVGKDDDKDTNWPALKKTSSQALALAVQESYGQRNARATPLGVASAMRTLLVSADQDTFRPTHIMEHLWAAGSDGILFKTKESEEKPDIEDLEDGKSLITSNITKEEARTVIPLFGKAHYAGSANTACNDVFDSCTQNLLGYTIFSKTGTTTFKSKNINTLATSCNKATEEKDKNCHLRPISWFVLATGTEQNQWSKVIVIMSERNWENSGSIQSSNTSSYIGFNLMKVLHEENLLSPVKLKDS